MLQSLRENLKGPTAKVVVGVAVAAMILFGVETLFVNSVGGTEVATVDGEDISKIELRRAIEQQKNRLRQQLQLEESNEMLSDERLQGPALMNLIRQKAITQAAKQGGMDVAPEVIKTQLAETFVKDGKFDAAFLNNYIAAYGFTPATLAKSEADSYVLRQLYSGINDSEFLTSAELNAVIAIASQARSFESLFVARDKVASSVVVAEEEIKTYYEANAPQFTEPEKVAVDFVELSMAVLAKTQSVTEDELKEEYEREVADFESKTELKVAHILLDQSAQNQIEMVSADIASGADFGQLAKKYSTDLGSKDGGGELGLLVEGVFPAAFEKAAKELAEGQISGPVKTDAGTHFIKLLSKTVSEVPTFEARKAALADSIREQKAGAEYLDALQNLENASFNASDLTAAAEAVKGQVNTSDFFPRAGGKTGITANAEVAEVAFSDEVLVGGQNSRVIELDGENAVVLRVKDRKPAVLKELAAVRAEIVSTLTDQKVAMALQALAAQAVAAIQQGKTATQVAENGQFVLSSHEKIERSAADVDVSVIREAFSMARPAAGNPSVSTAMAEKGIYVVVLKDVIDGDVNAMPKEQRDSIDRQLKMQLASASVEAFEEAIFQAVKYKIH